MHPIYFGTIDLNKTIHCQALGFTKQFYLYACAASQSEAEKLMETWATVKGCDVRKVVAKMLTQQDVRTYTFPEQIINLPASLLEAEYQRRDYPSSYRSPGRQVVLQQGGHHG